MDFLEVDHHGPRADVLTDVRSAIEPALSIMLAELHARQPLAPGEEWSIPISLDCGLDGSVVVRVAALGGCPAVDSASVTPGAPNSLGYQILRLANRFSMWMSLVAKPGIPRTILERQLTLIADAATKARDLMRAERGKRPGASPIGRTQDVRPAVSPAGQPLHVAVEAVSDAPLTIEPESGADGVSRLLRSALGIDRATPDGPDFDRLGSVQAARDLDLGPCCACGETKDTVRNLLMLNERAPVPGTGWGCLPCNVPADGAVAVACDACLERAEKGDGIRALLKWVVKGLPKNRERVPIDELSGGFGDEHDRQHARRTANERPFGRRTGHRPSPRSPFSEN